MKLLVFAHKPPPHHGQSYMVQLLLGVLEREKAIEFYHVDARFSSDLQDIGRATPGKLFLLLKYCLQAWWCRARYGVDTFLYVPAPNLRNAIYRDWLVFALCRPIFKKVIFYWHAFGLGEWLATEARPWERAITLALMGRADLSIVLANFNRKDAEELKPKQIAVVPNAIPDPCPDFEHTVRERRLARVQVRQKLLAGKPSPTQRPQVAGAEPDCFNVLFMGLCCREKGLMDAIEAVALANREWRARGIRVRLWVAGKFPLQSEQQAFEERIRQADLQAEGPMVIYRGFVSGKDKDRLFVESDCLCFPTYYRAESFGLVMVEALAYGLPVVASRWRMLPELLPPGATGLVDPQAPDQIAQALTKIMARDFDPGLREWFLQRFSLARFADRIDETLKLLA